MADGETINVIDHNEKLLSNRVSNQDDTLLRMNALVLTININKIVELIFKRYIIANNQEASKTAKILSRN